MTDKNYTAIDLIVDRSGSIASIKEDCEGGIRTFIKEQRQVPGKCTIRIDQFDNVFENVVPTTDIHNVGTFSLVPRSMTALVDAMGRSITEFGEELAALPEDERPGNVIVVVVTDGLENASRVWKRDEVFKLIEQQKKDYNWQFVFLAANQDAIKTGASFGFDPGNSLTFDADSKGVAASYNSLSTNMTALRSGAVMDWAFSDEDRQNASSGV